MGDRSDSSSAQQCGKVTFDVRLDKESAGRIRDIPSSTHLDKLREDENFKKRIGTNDVQFCLRDGTPISKKVENDYTIAEIINVAAEPWILVTDTTTGGVGSSATPAEFYFRVGDCSSLETIRDKFHQSIAKALEVERMSTLKAQQAHLKTNCILAPFPLTSFFVANEPRAEFLYEFPPVGEHFQLFVEAVKHSVAAGKQDRYSIAITQSTGTGKTKLVFALANGKWVIYVLFEDVESTYTPSGLLTSVINHACARAAFAEIGVDKDTLLAIRTKLHEGCFRLFAIFFYSYIQALQLFDEAMKVFHSENPKVLWMHVLQDGGQSIVRELFNINIALVNLDTDFSNFQKNMLDFATSQEVAFCFDEVHLLKGRQQGRFFHKEWRETLPEDRLKVQAMERENAPSDHNSTDMFYIMRWVSDEMLRIAKLPQILLTTEFSVWGFLTKIARLSPNRREFEPFYHLHVLTPNDVLAKVAQYFGAVPQELLRKIQQLSGRGYFFYVLFMQRVWAELEKSPPQSPDELHVLLDQVWHTAISDVDNTVTGRLQELSKHPIAEDLLVTLYFGVAMGNGNLLIPSKSAQALVARGLAYLRYQDGTEFGDKVPQSEETKRQLRKRLTPEVEKKPKTQAKVAIAEFLLRKYIWDMFPLSEQPSDDTIFKYALQVLNELGVWAGQGSSDKGRVAEKIVARIVYRECVARKQPLSVLLDQKLLLAGSFVNSCVPTFCECGEFEDFDVTTNQAIAFFTTPVNHGVFPKNSFGPDFGFSSICQQGKAKPRTIPAILQAKCVEGHMTYSLFVDALNSLSPLTFHNKNTNDRKQWLEHLAKNPIAQCIRIVYNFCGFTSTVINAVKAYNNESSNANFPILLMAGSVKQLGEPLHRALSALNSSSPAEVQAHYDIKDFVWKQ